MNQGNGRIAGCNCIGVVGLLIGYSTNDNQSLIADLCGADAAIHRDAEGDGDDLCGVHITKRSVGGFAAGAGGFIAAVRALKLVVRILFRAPSRSRAA